VENKRNSNQNSDEDAELGGNANSMLHVCAWMETTRGRECVKANDKPLKSSSLNENDVFSTADVESYTKPPSEKI